MKNAVCFASLCMICLAAQAQDQQKPTIPLKFMGDNWSIEPFFLQPNAFVYFDRSSDTETKIDLYQNGKLNGSFQAVGGDLVYTFDIEGVGGTIDYIRFGLSGGTGISTVSEDNESQDKEAGSALFFNLGPVLQVSHFLRIEGGFVWAWTSDDSFTSRTDRRDHGLYFGLSLPTNLSNALFGKNK